MNHTSKEIKRHPEKPSTARKHCALNISNSVIWDQIGTEDVGDITSGITGRYENQPRDQLAVLNKDKMESGEHSIP